MRWAESLASYDFRITYREGSKNAKADALSRRPDYIEGELIKTPTMLRENADGSLEFNYIQVAATYSAKDTE